MKITRVLKLKRKFKRRRSAKLKPYLYVHKFVYNSILYYKTVRLLINLNKLNHATSTTTKPPRA